MRAIAEQTRAEVELWYMMIGPVEAALLRLLVRLRGARRVLEIGTFTGYSAIAMAEALPDHGELVTLDISEEWTAIARRHWANSPHGAKIRLELAPASETLPQLRGPFDVAFIDADKTGYPAYWDATVPLLSPGGLIIVDNVLAGGRVVAPDSSHSRATDAFNDKVVADTRVETLMLPVRDGVTVAQRVG
ncbi:MAG: O-methyltransferase [Deltaproteobacteria bacterium]|nr:O-methyltransferase [Deltaproteobacteria bacterium]